MNLTLRRIDKGEKFTAGELLIDGKFLCWTLEDKERDLSAGCEAKVFGETAIPAGTYDVILSFSNRFQRYMPEVLNVPCFKGIRIHTGNRPEDSEGCILIGAEKSAGGSIYKSRVAYELLMRRLAEVEKTEKITLTII